MSTTPQSSPAAELVRAPLFVDVVSDVVCPWCYIGKRKLETALSRLRADEPGLAPTVRWHPFELNPDLPGEGMPRATYLENKFGGKTATEIYARVRAVGAEVVWTSPGRRSRSDSSSSCGTAACWRRRSR